MYFILGLPRSRTTWLAAFLSNDSTLCYHEKSLEFSNLEDLKTFVMKENCGISDTALILHWQWIKSNIPGAKIVVIDRPYEDVVYDLKTIGFDETPMLREIEKKIEIIKKYTSISVVRFSSLNRKEVVERLCNYIGIPFNEKKFVEFSEMMIQPKKELLLERVSRNIDNFKSLYGEWL